MLWDRSTLAAPRRAVVWQDRRSAAICDRLREAGHEDRVRALTGLRFDPYFTATKLTWLAENDEPAWRGVTEGSTVVGTVDSYLVARLTGGARHVDRRLERLAHPALRPRARRVERRAVRALRRAARGAAGGGRRPTARWGAPTPTRSSASTCRWRASRATSRRRCSARRASASGESKCTYGTGSFVLVNTGPEVVRSDAGLLSTVAWMAPDRSLTYALEGAIFVTGSAVQWLRDGLGIIGAAAESEALARTVPDSGGVVFVPALTGLGAPDWDPSARGTILGITRGTTRAHLARATLEAIAFEVRDVVELLPDVRHPAVDGGAAANGLLMQLQADTLAMPVERPEVLETTGLGAAFLAGLGTGVWSSTDELASTWRLDSRFEPGAPSPDATTYERWRAAVDVAKGWAAD